MEINNAKKNEIIELATFVADEFCPEGIVQPEIIASQSGITYNYGDYGTYFDGILEYESGDFHIYLNNHNKFQKNNPRIRFSFAHELGHYFIDEHRNALKRGKSLHKSYYRLLPKNLIEFEADCFASNLLMPPSRFQQFIKKRKFEFSLIEALSKEFGTSLSATLFKFVEIGNHPIMVVYSENNQIKHFWPSFDFPYKFFKDYNSISKKVPPLTVAGDFFTNGIKCEDTEIVNACDWFSSYKDIRGIRLHERCIYPTYNNVVISVIWE